MLGTKKTKMDKNLTSFPKELLSNGRNNQGSNVVNFVKVMPSVLLEHKGRTTYFCPEVSEKVSQKRWSAQAKPSSYSLKRSKDKEGELYTYNRLGDRVNTHPAFPEMEESLGTQDSQC